MSAAKTCTYHDYMGHLDKGKDCSSKSEMAGLRTILTVKDILQIFGFKYSTGDMWIHNTIGYVSIGEEIGVEDLAMIIFQRGKQAKAAELRKVLGIID